MAGPRALTPEEAVAASRALARDGLWRRELRKAYRPIGTFAAVRARPEMRASGDRRVAVAAKSLRSAPTPSAAVISAGSREVPFAVAALMGMHRGTRTGWNLNTYSGPGVVTGVRALGERSRPQHLDWVGNSWTVATRGQGPRGLNDALADNVGEIGDMFIEAAWAVIVRAFPPGSIT